MTYNDLTSEQQKLIDLARQGKNVLVDACIGSGKTTTIQVLCNEIKDKRIVYLTYNRLLKIDAKEKITAKNVMVQNYHGFAWLLLDSVGIRTGIGEIIQTFNRVRPYKFNFDILVIDEYQDIEQELAEMLCILKGQNPRLQIIAVGDMQQKIYDKTTLDVPQFINNFLESYTVLHFTNCFRLSKTLANRLGNIWHKTINGVNPKCKVSEMKLNDVIDFLKKQEPQDILCLGPRNGLLPFTLNLLEKQMPEKFNKDTVYASIRVDGQESVAPDKSSAIFTTFDSSKGLERKICVVFGFDESYWATRIGVPLAKYEIIRNIFLVAASRGKEHIIFVKNNKYKMLSDETLIKEEQMKTSFTKPFLMSEMFDFKFKEDIEECFGLLDIKKKQDEDDKIYINNSDGYIDLSPCIGVYAEAHFFRKYNIDDQISFMRDMRDDGVVIKLKPDATLDDKILALTAYSTHLQRYVSQIKPPFVTPEQADRIDERLAEVFNRTDNVEVECGVTLQYKGTVTYDDNGKEKTIPVTRSINIDGRADVLKDDVIYELKFVDTLQHTHFLQLACYMAAMFKNKGILWNIRNNEMWEVTIPNRDKFLTAVVKTITKGVVEKVEEVDYVTREERERKKNKLRIGHPA